MHGHRRFTLPVALLLLMLCGLRAEAAPPHASLDSSLLASTSNEPDLDESDVLAAINRWSGELYGDHPQAALAYTWACQLDPVTAEIAGQWREATKGAESVEEKVAAIDAWNAAHMSHTQMQPQFSELAGKDPWGLTTEGGPTFRKLLPSEMKAMRGLTGSISGKCMSLANLLLCGLTQIGVRPEDMAVIHVRMGKANHAAVMFLWDGELVRTNNHRLGMFYGAGYHAPYPPAPTPILALYNQSFFNGGGYDAPVGILNEGKIALDRPLMNQVVTLLGGPSVVPESAKPITAPFAEPDRFREWIFSGEDHDAGVVPWLTRYAYQSLYVKHPGHYLTASMREPHARELATKLTEPMAMLEWMRNKLAKSSIFGDESARIMTADQVIVFGTGGPADRGILYCTLLRHNGIPAELVLSANGAYVHLSTLWCDMQTMKLVHSAPEPLLVIGESM